MPWTGTYTGNRVDLGCCIMQLTISMKVQTFEFPNKFCMKAEKLEFPNMFCNHVGCATH